MVNYMLHEFHLSNIVTSIFKMSSEKLKIHRKTIKNIENLGENTLMQIVKYIWVQNR